MHYSQFCKTTSTFGTPVDIGTTQGAVVVLANKEVLEEGFFDHDDLNIPPPKAFALAVGDDNKATELKICSFARPHMRAFHYSGWSCFIAFFIWFSVAPLLREVRKTLDLSTEDIWTTNIVAVAGDIVLRFIFGAVCDQFGARLPMGFVLIAASIPTAMTGLVNSLAGLAILRLFIGIAGSSFVVSQSWSTRMFSKDIVGVTNGLVGGWTDVGGGVAQIVIGTLLFPLFRDVLYDGDAETAWRTVCVVPAIVAALTAIMVVTTSEDCPDGNYKEIKKQGHTPEDDSASASFRLGAADPNTWLLTIQYACCGGVGYIMNNFAATHFVDEFDLSTESAGAIASIFGFVSIFSRCLGGFTSDKCMARYGMRGRVAWQTTTLVLEGICIFLFAMVEELWAAILLLTLLSISVFFAQGSTYGIVPYVNRSAPGAVAGIVGAGGSTGGVLFGLGFRQLPNTRDAYFLMASVVVFSGLLSVFINIKGYRGLLCEETEEVLEKLNVKHQVPEVDGGAKADEEEI
jgi:NNP family nitrate/nitrite transporter-like MFS transporter